MVTTGKFQPFWSELKYDAWIPSCIAFPTFNDPESGINKAISLTSFEFKNKRQLMSAGKSLFAG